MPRYLVERHFIVGPDEMEVMGRRSRVIAEERFPEVKWEHSHVAIGDDGKVQTFCVYESPDEGTIRRHAEELGSHQIMRVAELAGDVTPADFPG